MNRFAEFWRKLWYGHPILCNIFLILVSLVCLGWATICFLDIWTHHGQVAKVPNVINMGFKEGVETLHEASLDVIVADSVYRKDLRGGTIVDVIPQPGAIVKANREVFITIVAFSAEPVVLDMQLTDISWRQAEAYLKAKGLKVQKQYVPSQYPDVVVAVRCRGKEVTLGDKVTIDDVITLEVGQVPTPVAPPSSDGLDDAINAIYAAGSNVSIDDDGDEVSDGQVSVGTVE